jgi:hypothetical protein
MHHNHPVQRYDEISMKFLQLAILFGVLIVLSGCAMVPPVKNEIPVLGQSSIAGSKEANKVKILIFNASNPVWSGPNSGMDIWLDTKGLVRLETGQYVELFVSPGAHTLKLLHQDMLDFYSTHEIVIDQSQPFMEVCSAATTNKVRVLGELTEKFSESFYSVHSTSPSYFALRSLPVFAERLRIEREEIKGAFCYW